MTEQNLVIILINDSLGAGNRRLEAEVHRMRDTDGGSYKAKIPEALHHSDPHRSSTYWRHSPKILVELPTGWHRMGCRQVFRPEISGLRRA